MVGIAAAVRLRYVYTDRRWWVGGDGFDYHFSALRLADGLGYTSAFGDIGAQTAHHPPGWVTVLGAVSWLGARSFRDHELVAVAFGLGVVALAGLIGRRYFNARVGLIAALLAAVYPGFWVLEGNVLSEPLGLFVLGLFMLAMFDLRKSPTLARSALVGAVCGVVALVRSEEIFLLLLVVAPVLLLRRERSIRHRVVALVVAVVACFAVIAPWTIYNNTRFKAPVLLSTNDGGTLLLGNCPPATYSGTLLGWHDSTCLSAISVTHREDDRSEVDVLARKRAVKNIANNLGRLPVVVPARFGRLLAVFRPSQTVAFVASWMKTSTKPIWAWVVSFWVLLLLGVYGLVIARRQRAFLLPLLAPALIVIVNVATSYGEPRYHTMSDLGIIVLAAVALDRVMTSAPRRRASRRGVDSTPAARDHGVR